MSDSFLTAAGPAPARGAAGRWRQVALLAAASAIDGDPRARVRLSAALSALDRPAAASAVTGHAADGAWAVWWGVLAAGAAGGRPELERALVEARVEGDDPDAREVSRRLTDLREEAAGLAGGDPGGARFALVGQGTGDMGAPRALLLGRSSAAFLVEPSWESVRLVRLAPSDGPSAGNRAHMSLEEVIAAVRRGEHGGRAMPPDEAPPLAPGELIDALREGAEERDRRLLALAEEVQRERARLAEAWEALEAERLAMAAERRRRQRVPPPPPPRGPRRAPAPEVAVPRDRRGAAALLGVAPEASERDVERAYREQVARCHPDRVAEMHPRIRAQAEGLTVALNTARDLMLGRGGRRRAS
jgi:DnaJ-domain-containing protein 1